MFQNLHLSLLLCIFGSFGLLFHFFNFLIFLLSMYEAKVHIFLLEDCLGMNFGVGVCWDPIRYIYRQYFVISKYRNSDILISCVCRVFKEYLIK